MTPQELARAKEIYEIAQSKGIGERKVYLSTLTEIEKGYYKKEVNKANQKNFLKKPENKVRYNMERRDNIERKRQEEKEKMAEQNRKDVKAFREREKELKSQIEAKIKAQIEAKAKEEKANEVLAKQAKEKADIINDILNNIIDTIPKKAQQKRNKEAVKRHRAKKAQGEPIKKYNKKK
jgi:hypothetical protein